MRSLTRGPLGSKWSHCILRLDYQCAAPLNGELNLLLQKVREIQLSSVPLHPKLSRIKTKNEKENKIKFHSRDHILWSIMHKCNGNSIRPSTAHFALTKLVPLGEAGSRSVSHPASRLQSGDEQGMVQHQSNVLSTVQEQNWSPAGALLNGCTAFSGGGMCL